MPLYVGDYLGDTGHLTTAQHGAYLLLMMHYWRKGELPDDDRQLSKITKLPLKTWCDYRPILQDFFHDGWKHKRIDAELERMVRLSEKRAVAGQKGGLGSALARMKLEMPRGEGRSPQQLLNACRARLWRAPTTHTHTHIRIFLPGRPATKRVRSPAQRRPRRKQAKRYQSARSLPPMSREKLPEQNDL
jgi:uncharacterized protein YdaU (DUF1376 family)